MFTSLVLEEPDKSYSKLSKCALKKMNKAAWQNIFNHSGVSKAG